MINNKVKMFKERIIQTKIKYIGKKHKYLEEVKEVKAKNHQIISITDEDTKYYCLNCLEEIKDISVTIMDTDDYKRQVLNMTEEEILLGKNLNVQELSFTDDFSFEDNLDSVENSMIDEINNNFQVKFLRFHCKKCNIRVAYHFTGDKKSLKYPVNNKPIFNDEFESWHIEDFYTCNKDKAYYSLGQIRHTDKIKFVKDMSHKIFGAYIYSTLVIIMYNAKTNQINFVKKHFKIQYRYYGSTARWMKICFVYKNGNYVLMNKKELIRNRINNGYIHPYAVQSEICDELRCLNCKDDFAFVKFSINCIFEMKLQTVNSKEIILNEKKNPFSNEYLICKRLFIDMRIPYLTLEDKNRLYIDIDDDNIMFKYNYFKYIKEESEEGRNEFFKKIDVLPHTKKAKQLTNKSLAYAVIYKKMKEYGFKNLDLFYQICNFDKQNANDLDELLKICFNIPAKRFFKNYLKYSSEKKILMDIKNTNSEIICDAIMIYNQMYNKGYNRLLVTAGGKSLFKLSIREFHDEISRINNRIVEDKHLNVALSNKKQKELSNTYIYDNDKYEFSVVTENLKLVEIGQVMNICVGSYGHKVNIHHCNIVSVVKNDNIYAACIELDGSGKSICQAKGYRNNYLHENTHHVVNQWIEDHKLQIKTGDLTNVLKSATNQREYDFHRKEIGEVNMIPEKF